jgi:hypothetical protein
MAMLTVAGADASRWQRRRVVGARMSCHGDERQACRGLQVYRMCVWFVIGAARRRIIAVVQCMHQENTAEVCRSVALHLWFARFAWELDVA